MFKQRFCKFLKLIFGLEKYGVCQNQFLVFCQLDTCHVLVHTQKYHEIKKVILTTVHYNTNSLFWPEIIPFHPQILFSLRNTSQYFLTKIDHFQSDQKSTNLDGWVPVIDTQHSNTDKIQHKKWFSYVVNLTMKRGDKIFIFRVEGISHSCIMHTA